jgi:hypothetical protein
MSLRLHYGGALVALAGLLTIAPPSFAQNASSNAPIAPPSPAQAIDNTTGFGKFWDEISLGSDAKWLFGIDYEDKKIEKRSRQFEALYLDTLRQYDDDYPNMRSRDLPSPYTTSVMSLEPEVTNSGGTPVAVPPTDSDAGNYPPEPPTPVPGMW